MVLYCTNRTFYRPTTTVHLNLPLTGNFVHFYFLKKTPSVWFICLLNYGDAENVLYTNTNLCPHKPHKHAHTHRDANTHTHTETHTHTHTERDTHTHTHTQRHTLSLSHTHTHTHTHTHSRRTEDFSCVTSHEPLLPAVTREKQGFVLRCAGEYG